MFERSFSHLRVSLHGNLVGAYLLDLGLGSKPGSSQLQLALSLNLRLAQLMCLVGLVLEVFQQFGPARD